VPGAFHNSKTSAPPGVFVASAVDEPEGQVSTDVGQVRVVTYEDEKAIAGSTRSRLWLCGPGLLHGLKDVKEEIRGLDAGDVCGTLCNVFLGRMAIDHVQQLVKINAAPTHLRCAHPSVYSSSKFSAMVEAIADGECNSTRWSLFRRQWRKELQRGLRP